MSLFLLRFWPALVPLLVYWIWLKYVGRKATIEGKPVLSFREGPWYWAVLASLLTALGCFFVLGAAIEPHKGEYVPPRIEDGTIIPGHIDE